MTELEQAVLKRLDDIAYAMSVLATAARGDGIHIVLPSAPPIPVFVAELPKL